MHESILLALNTSSCGELCIDCKNYDPETVKKFFVEKFSNYWTTSLTIFEDIYHVRPDHGYAYMPVMARVKENKVLARIEELNISKNVLSYEDAMKSLEHLTGANISGIVRSSLAKHQGGATCMKFLDNECGNESLQFAIKDTASVFPGIEYEGYVEYIYQDRNGNDEIEQYEITMDAFGKEIPGKTWTEIGLAMATGWDNGYFQNNLEAQMDTLEEDDIAQMLYQLLEYKEYIPPEEVSDFFSRYSEKRKQAPLLTKMNLSISFEME